MNIENEFMSLLQNVGDGLLADVFLFVGVVILMYALSLLRHYLELKNSETELNLIENFALQAVRFAEALDLNGKLTQYGMDKKTVAIQRLESHLGTMKIKASLSDLDEAIETAWYKEFKIDKD